MAFRKRILLALLFCFCTHFTKAQYITIPDTTFLNVLYGQFPSCLVGNQLDTTCAGIVNVTSWHLSGGTISDLTGITYFDSLKIFTCEENLLTFLPPLPSKLKYLSVVDNQISSLSNLPSTLEYLDVSDNNLSVIPALPSNLEVLICGFNQLTSLPTLPANLKELAYQYNQISNLPVLPNGLNRLVCTGNAMTSLTALPLSLIGLSCDINQLTSLPNLPFSLEELSCSDNLLATLPSLPVNLVELNCNGNQLTSLPVLPVGILSLFCSNNMLTSLPVLPDTLGYLIISDNPGLSCLPPIDCIGWSNGGDFVWANTGIECFPNAISVQNAVPSIANVPICDVININNCSVNWNLKGTIGNDINGNCLIDSIEPKLGNIKLNLFQSGNLVQHTYSNQIGQFSFTTDTGNFECVMDTNGVAYSVQCPVTFSYNANILSALSNYNNLDFSLQCKPNFDIGIATANLDSGIFRPANFAVVSIAAGDMSSPYNLNCASGVSGNVRVIINGPANFVNAASGSLIPFVSGDTLIYSIPDFGAVNFYNDFRFLVQTDTLAQLNDQVCFNILVTPVAGDNNQANNYYTHCFTVVNSYDPNDKQVSPSGLTDTSLYDLTYTIRFQNTGNAPAQHIYVLDTLDQNIDESSFQLLAYSHEPQMQIIGKRVRFNFPNINLPDSVNNEPESHGFVQYRVKRKNNLPIGTKIQNTAYIYFDFNPPIQTNTTTNEIAVTSNVGIGENQNPILFSIFPNPIASGQMLNIYFNSSEKKKAELSVYDLSGRKLFTQFVNASEQSQVVALPNIYAGVYLVVLNDGKHQAQQKLVVLNNSN
ncbi:MAG: T9SS type A sorting domain-containing protein [Saprospiraceae bacterium]|nr:T9SS type A sorting domain-containing protein [Saprospiraceae bacterium]